jgi:hypothetical protein
MKSVILLLLVATMVSCSDNGGGGLSSTAVVGTASAVSEEWPDDLWAYSDQVPTNDYYCH